RASRYSISLETTQIQILLPRSTSTPGGFVLISLPFHAFPSSLVQSAPIALNNATYPLPTLLPFSMLSLRPKNQVPPLESCFRVSSNISLGNQAWVLNPDTERCRDGRSYAMIAAFSCCTTNGSASDPVQ